MKRRCDEREAYHLARKLVLGQSKYLSKGGELNSDGRKLLEELVRSALRCRPELKSLVTRVRKRPVLENVIKLVEAFVDRGEVEGILEVLREGPYTYPRTLLGKRAERLR